jgi:putative membrane protein
MMFWYGPGTGMSGWGSGLMMVGMLVFWGLLLFAVVFGVRYAVRATPVRRTAPRPAPETLLAERFASGAIDADTYRHDLAELREAGAPR